jgi:chemotaxis protein histidine kinase CheA
MGERKVLNKYIPPDFDPAKIPRSKKGTGVKAQQKVRMMLPMSIRCDTCGNYITKGTKFNARKEDVIGEDYLGITIFRFYFRCNRCSAEIAMKTDPKNSDYVVEAGAKRNFEPWREKDEAQAAADEQQEREEEGNSMKALENRTLESKREMDIMAALDEMRSLNARHAKISSADAIGALRAQSEADRLAAEEAEEAMAKRVFEEAKARTAGFVRRLDSDEDEDEDDGGGGAGPSGETGAAAKRRKVAAATEALAPSAARAAAPARPKPTFAVKPKAAVAVVVKPKPTPEPERSGSDSDSAGGLGLLGDYGSDSRE